MALREKYALHAVYGNPSLNFRLTQVIHPRKAVGIADAGNARIEKKRKEEIKEKEIAGELIQIYLKS
jgi:hypothetical protein